MYVELLFRMEDQSAAKMTSEEDQAGVLTGCPHHSEVQPFLQIMEEIMWNESKRKEPEKGVRYLRESNVFPDGIFTKYSSSRVSYQTLSKGE